jgi:solute carrier family 25 iron transporter 28/37
MDTIKTHIQCAECPNNAANASASASATCKQVPPASSSIMSTFRSIHSADQSVLRLWRGVHTMFLGCIPAHALYFSSYEVTKSYLEADQVGVHTPIAAGITGAVSTLCHDCIMTPMDTIKQRLQLGYYSGMWDCVKSMARTEGIGSFYRSFGTTLAMNLPYGMVMVASNESLKKMLSPDGKFSLTTSLIAGSGAGAIASAATCPLDCIKTRLQTQSLSGGGIARNGAVEVTMHRALHTARPGPMCKHLPKESQRPVAIKYSGFSEAAKDFLRSEGVAGLFRGLAPRMATQMPAVAISWTVYEGAKKLLTEHA